MSNTPTKTPDDGGPAFPWHSDGMAEHILPHTGMSLRDYFAAHAPETPAEWFAPTSMDKPVRRWRAEPLPHGTTATMGHCEACNAYFDREKQRDADHVRAESAYEMSRYVQWPWAYADAMLAARKAGLQ